MRCIVQQNGHLSNYFIQVDRFLFWRPSPVERVNSVDDLRGARHVHDHCRGCGARFFHSGASRRSHRVQALARTTAAVIGCLIS